MTRHHLRPTARALAILAYASILITMCASAKTPCDFKGVSVGDQMTPAAIMAAFAVKSYKLNPARQSIDRMLDLVHKYGLTAAGEIEDWKIGPACGIDYCRIPFGVSVGNDNLPVSVFVAFRDGRITAIDVFFNQLYWEEIRPILDKKYGSSWRVDRDPSFVITDLETKKSIQVESTRLTHQTNGTNPKSGDTCVLWALNYDMVFTHHDPLGLFHSVFEIALVSKNF